MKPHALLIAVLSGLLLQIACGDRESHAPESSKEPVPVSLNVFNLLGQRVRTLVHAVQTSGEYQLIWDGRDDTGVSLASGVYFLRLQVGQDSQTRKVVLTR